MSLSGNLGFVSLDEVLRLLTRSNQRGSVDVRGEDVHGRIYVTKGGIVLATTSDDAGMHRHLVKSGLVDEAYLESVESGDATLEPIVEKSGGAIVDLLRETTVESIYQLGLKGDSFEVFEDQQTAYASPKAFDLETLLDDSKQRLSDWAEVSKTVKDLYGMIGFRRDLGERTDVSIDRDGWRVLSEIGSGASVADIAAELGTTEFWTARVAARLIKADLIAIDEPQPEYEAPVEDEPAGTWDSRPEPTEEHVDPNQSWWQEPAKDESQEPAVEESDDYYVAEHPMAAEMPVAGAEDTQVAAAAEYADEDDVEEDTEAFLEKVFSELDTSAEEGEEGYGLLRRRRMGAMRDSSSDS